MAGCSSPTAPTPADAVSIAGPKTGLLNRSYTFNGTINFSSQAMLYYRWTFDDSMFTSNTTPDSSSVSWTFQKLGPHIIHADVLRTGDNAKLCSVTDTFTVVPEEISVSFDSSKSQILAPIVFTAHLSPEQFPRSYQLIWMFDSNTVQRSNCDTVSFSFASIGRHTVSVFYPDTVSKSLVQVSMTFSVGPLLDSFSLSTLSSFHRAIAVFSDQTMQSPTAQQLFWNGNKFSDGYMDTSYSIDYINYSNFFLYGSISSDGMSVDSISDYWYTESIYTPFSDVTAQSEWFAGRSLRLIWFTPDSACYELRGQNLEGQIDFAVDTWYPGGSSPVNWGNPTWLSVTFYRK